MGGRKKGKTKSQWHKKRSEETEACIIKILADGDPHQYSELKKETKLSKATLSKHLKDMTEKNIITKKMDTKSGKYPYPVYYKLKEDNELTKTFRALMKQIEKMGEVFAKSKKPEVFLWNMGKGLELSLIGIMEFLKDARQKRLPKEEVERDLDILFENSLTEFKTWMYIFTATFGEYVEQIDWEALRQSIHKEIEINIE